MKFFILAAALLASAMADKPSPTYSAPSSSASQDSYSAPVAASAPVASSYSPPSQSAGDSYGSPKAPAKPAVDSYGSPKAPPAAAPAPAAGQVGSQGYYYYYPVQNSGGHQTYQSGPSYGVPSYGGYKEDGLGGLLAGKGLLIAIVIGFGIVLAIAGGSLIVGNGRSLESAISTAKYYIGDVDQDDLFATVSRGLDFLDNLRDIYA